MVMEEKLYEWVNNVKFKGIIDVETYNTVQNMLNENRTVRNGGIRCLS